MVVYSLLPGLVTSRLRVIPAATQQSKGDKRCSPCSPLWLTLILLTSWYTCEGSQVYLQLLETQPPLTQEDTRSPLPDGLRPSPSDRLPIEDLLENPDQALDPSPKNLDPKVLRRRLGRHFDEQFLSIDRPEDLNDTFVYDFKNGRPNEPRPDYLQFLRTFRLADGRRVRLRGSRKQRRRLQKLMWSFTYCPVRFSWKDLGLRFWPRWLRVGGCWNGKPCSIPPGMTCQPSASVSKTLLRWHCRPRRSRRGRRRCRWIRFRYPIITRCSCAC